MATSISSKSSPSILGASVTNWTGRECRGSDHQEPGGHVLKQNPLVACEAFGYTQKERLSEKLKSVLFGFTLDIRDGIQE